MKICTFHGSFQTQPSLKSNIKFTFTSSTPIDALGLKIQGRGYLMFFAKIPRGVKAFRKNYLGGPPFFGFYCICINKHFEICLRGVLYLPSPLCASMSIPHPTKFSKAFPVIPIF
jgi:hypothetical protein